MAVSLISLRGFSQNTNVVLKSLPSSFQDTEYGLGVSACYAGTIGNRIVIAGGANFPTPGKKKYYSSIYSAKVNDRKLVWEEIGTLPKPSAYGVTVTSGDSMILFGGCNADGSISDVYSIHLDKHTGKAIVHSLPSMPCTIDNAYDALYINKVYVVGGNKDNKPSSDIFSFDLTSNKWNLEATIPDFPRVQPVCACSNNKLFIWGGFYMNNEDSKVATDGYCYDLITKEFHHINGPVDSNGNEVTLSGGTAITYPDKHNNSTILCTGGVNKDIFLDAISGRYNLVERTEYLSQPIEWYKFNGSLFSFDPIKEEWSIIIDRLHSPLSRAGAAILNHKSNIYYIGGELKPGLRTPETIMISKKYLLK